MNDRETAALRRKHAATREPAKRAELASLLRSQGVDPEASEVVEAAPKGRTAPVKVTAAQTKPVATTTPETPAKKTVSEDAGRPARTRPSRASKAETSK